MHSPGHGTSQLSLRVHCTNSYTVTILPKKEKKHASDLSPYPAKLIPFQPVDGAGANTWYGQIYKPVSTHPFKEAGLKRFSPNQLFKAATNLAQTVQCAAFHWPSLSELNDEISPFPWASNEEYECYMSGNSISTLLVLTTEPPPAALLGFICRPWFPYMVPYGRRMDRGLKYLFIEDTGSGSFPLPWNFLVFTP